MKIHSIRKGLPAKVAEVMCNYHASMLDVYDVLWQLHILKDDQVEALKKKHVMAIFTDCFPRMGYNSLDQKD